MNDARLSLAGGVLGELLYGRRDIAKYGVAFAAGDNVFVRKHGPASNRAGTIYVADVGTTDCKLLPFKFDADEQYVLIFSDLEMKVVKAGTLGFVQSGGSDYTLTTPYATAHLSDVRLTQKGDVAYLTHPLYAPRQLTRLADDNWTLAVVTFEPAIAAPTSPGASFTSGTYSASEGSSFKVAAISETGEESLPTSAFDDGGSGGTGYIDLSWTASSGAIYYVVYKLQNGTYGYIGRTDTTAFQDTGYDPDTSDTPQGDRNPFSGAGAYPGVSARWQQRQIYANSVDEPLRVDASQSFSLDNFNYSTPAQESDAWDITIDAPIQGEIRHLINLGGLFALTSEQVVEIMPTEGNVAKPGQIQAIARLQIGASAVEPVQVVDNILFVEDTGDTIQSIRRDDVYVEKVIPNERSILAPDFFDNKTIKRLAYARSPFSLMPVVQTDGSCVVMAFVPEHDAWGWTNWTTPASGLFRDVVVLRESGRDVPYFLIERTIDGAAVVYLEKLADRIDVPASIENACYVDSAVVYTGAATDTLSGFDHLEGETLVGLAGGKVVRNVTVSGGNISLQKAATPIILGLEVIPSIRTLPPARGRSHVKATPAVWVDLYRTSTIRAGTTNDPAEMTIYAPDPPPTYASPVQLRSGVVELPIETDYDREAQIWIQGVDPLPFTVRGYELDVKGGGK